MKNLEDLLDFNNLNKEHSVLSNENRKVPGIFKIETPESFSLDEIVCLRSKAHCSKWSNVSKTTLKAIRKAVKNNIRFEEFL